MSASGTCLEEGEIADSGESENENVPKMEMFRDRKKVDQLFQSATSYRTVHNTCGDSSSDSSDDDEQEFNTSPIKAKRGRKHFSSTDDNHTDLAGNEGFLKASQQFQRKQNQELWNKVALEQTIDESIRKVNTIEKDSGDECEDRGVESYNYKCKAELEAGNARETVDYGDEDMFGDSELEEADGDLDGCAEASAEANICDIESFGVDSVRTKPALHELHGLGAVQMHTSRKRTIKDRLSRKQTSNMTESGERKSVRDRLGTRRPGVGHKFSRKATFNFHCKESDEPNIVTSALIEALGEPHYQMELFQRVVNTIGVKKAIELYYATENIEENGGMLVQNGDRRRSPGGVFLQVVKNESTKDMIKSMFPFQKLKKKPRKKQNKNLPNELSSSSPGEKELPSKAEVLLGLEKRKVAMDLGQSGDDDLDLDQAEVGIEIDFPDD